MGASQVWQAQAERKRSVQVVGAKGEIEQYSLLQARVFVFFDELLVVEYSLLLSLQGFSTDHESRRSAGTAGLGLGKTSSCSIS